MRSRAATWVNLVFASIIVVSVFLQAYFITAYFTGEPDALDWHGFIGGIVIHASELIVFISALIAFWRMWGWLAFNFGLFVFGTIQIFLSPPDEDPASGWVHGLHGLFALGVLVWAAVIADRDMRWLGMRGEPMAPATTPTRTADPV
jgi:CDP-diglyceride synthetase